MDLEKKESEQTEQKVEQPADEPKVEDVIKAKDNYIEKLKKESIENSNKYKKLRDEIMKKEEDELKKKNDVDKLLELEKNKAKELEEKYKALQYGTMKTSLKFEVAKFAKDAHDIHDVINNLNHDNIIMDQDETGNFKFDGIDKEVERLRAGKAYLFASKDPSKQVTRPPSGSTSAGLSYEDWKKLPYDEMKKKFKEIKIE